MAFSENDSPNIKQISLYVSGNEEKHFILRTEVKNVFRRKLRGD
jgi:hypothetical protein